jgi:hypothetical protein
MSFLGKWTTGKPEKLSVPAPAFILVSYETIKKLSFRRCLRWLWICFTFFKLISDLDPFTLMRIGISMLLPVVDPDLDFLDPYLFGGLGSGSGSRSMEIDQNLQINMVFCLSMVPI